MSIGGAKISCPPFTPALDELNCLKSARTCNHKRKSLKWASSKFSDFSKLVLVGCGIVFKLNTKKV